MVVSSLYISMKSDSAVSLPYSGWRFETSPEYMLREVFVRRQETYNFTFFATRSE